MSKLLLLAAASLPATQGAPASLFQGLASVRFANAGTTNKTDSFTWLPITPTQGKVLYLESYNVSATSGTCGAGSWSQGGEYPYLFQLNNTVAPACELMDEAPGFDRPGGDLHNVAIDTSGGKNGTVICANLCCNTPSCVAFVYVQCALLSSALRPWR